MATGETGGSRIFISYRRDDAAGEAGRLSDDIQRALGKDSVFLDVVGIQLGRDFRKVIHQNVGGCAVLLAVIGPQWATITAPDGTPRILQPHDYVRLEIATALQRDILVIPVLVRGAHLPKLDQLPEDLQEMVYRNSVELTHPRWHSDVALLITALTELIRETAPQPGEVPELTSTPVDDAKRLAGEAAAAMAAQEKIRVEQESAKAAEEERIQQEAAKAAEEARRQQETLRIEQEAAKAAEEARLRQTAAKAADEAKRQQDKIRAELEAAREESERRHKALSLQKENDEADRRKLEEYRLAQDRERLEQEKRQSANAQTPAARAERGRPDSRLTVDDASSSFPQPETLGTEKTPPLLVGYFLTKPSAYAVLLFSVFSPIIGHMASYWLEYLPSIWTQMVELVFSFQLVSVGLLFFGSRVDKTKWPIAIGLMGVSAVLAHYLSSTILCLGSIPAVALFYMLWALAACSLGSFLQARFGAWRVVVSLVGVWASFMLLFHLGTTLHRLVGYPNYLFAFAPAIVLAWVLFRVGAVATSRPAQRAG